MTHHTYYLPLALSNQAKAVAATIAFVGSLMISALGLPSMVSALECTRAPHIVTTYGDSAQSASPGSTLYYHLEITSQDPAECGSSEYTFDVSDAPTGWVAAPANGTQDVDYLEKTMYTVWYTSPTNAYNGDYDLTVSVSRANEPTVVSVPLTYTVVGGVDQPQPDVTAPSISIVSPNNGSFVKKKSVTTIKANANDNVGVTRVEYYVNGKILCSGLATSCKWTVPGGHTAAYTIEVRAFDAAGNKGSSTIRVVSR